MTRTKPDPEAGEVTVAQPLPSGALRIVVRALVLLVLAAPALAGDGESQDPDGAAAIASL